MRLKVVDQVDSGFTLEPDAQTTLFDLLRSEEFYQQICKGTGAVRVEFTEKLFQPVPYSLTTPKGMPAEFEQYYESKEFVIINVPPPFMFKAKIFKPSRLCAVYRIFQASADGG